MIWCGLSEALVETTKSATGSARRTDCAEWLPPWLTLEIWTRSNSGPVSTACTSVPLGCRQRPRWWRRGLRRGRRGRLPVRPVRQHEGSVALGRPAHPVRQDGVGPEPGEPLRRGQSGPSGLPAISPTAWERVSASPACTFTRGTQKRVPSGEIFRNKQAPTCVHPLWQKHQPLCLRRWCSRRERQPVLPVLPGDGLTLCRVRGRAVSWERASGCRRPYRQPYQCRTDLLIYWSTGLLVYSSTPLSISHAVLMVPSGGSQVGPAYCPSLAS